MGFHSMADAVIFFLMNVFYNYKNITTADLPGHNNLFCTYMFLFPSNMI